MKEPSINKFIHNPFHPHHIGRMIVYNCINAFFIVETICAIFAKLNLLIFNNLSNFNQMALYSKALCDGNNLISINSVNKCDRKNHTYICPHCGDVLFPILGEIREIHFRHQTKECSYNGYLHSIAERAFMEEYKKCLNEGLPFLLESKRQVRCSTSCRVWDCQKHYTQVTTDLTKKYTKASLEQRVSIDGHSRRPDILLESDEGEQLWVEIWVSHESDQDKKKENAIIEIKIVSEKDTDAFHEHRLVEGTVDAKDRGTGKVSVHVYNFHSGAIDCPRFVERIPFETPTQTTQPISRPRYTPIKVEPHRIKPVAPQPPLVQEPGWVDLGLPSHNLWAEQDSSSSIRYTEARRSFNLPTEKDVLELNKYCTKQQKNGELIITGQNGNNIKLSVEQTYWMKENNSKNRFVPFGALVTNDEDYGCFGRVRLVKKGCLSSESLDLPFND